MTDIPIITGNFPDGSPFVFSLNGAATQKQMERLIELTAVLAKQRKDIKTDPAMAAYVDSLKNNTKEVDKNTDLQRSNTKETLNFHDALQNLSTVTHLARGHLSAAFNGINKPATALAAGLGGMVGKLFDYSNDLGKAMQRGVSGDVMDFALAAKTGGLSLDQMNKALEESGGSFAQLGDGATDGAKRFGELVNGVRTATASVGNLGLTNEQQAMFAAQQLKIAIAQGFKGRAAQAQVMESTKELAVELENLSSRTGKSVLELAGAAQKLAMSPLVSNFVATAREGRTQISKAVNSFAASMQGVFGKTTEQLSSDALENAMAGLPLSVSEAGKNLLLASSGVYSEFERQARMAAAGQEVTEQDRQKLREMVLREVDARRQELTFMARLPGAAGDSAKQLLAMAQEARNYNTDAAKKKRAEEETSRKFMASTNELRANLQQLMIPVVNLLNGVNWALLVQILQGFTATLEVILSPLTLLGKILADTGLGSVVGGFLGIATAISVTVSGFSLLKRSIADLATTIFGARGKIAMAAAGRGGFNFPQGGPASPVGGKPGGTSIILDQYGNPIRYDTVPPTAPGGAKPGTSSRWGRIGAFMGSNALALGGVAATMAGAGMSMAGDRKLAEDSESMWGKILSVGGKALEWMGIIAGLAPVIKMAIDGFTGFRLGLSLVTAFMSKQLMAALMAFKTGLTVAGAKTGWGGAGDLAGAARGKMGKWGTIGGTVLAGGLSMWELSNIEEQRAAGAISDRQATKESASTVGAFGGGGAGAAIGAGFGAAFGGVGAIPGAIIGGLLGSLLGGGAGYGAAHLLTSDDEGASSALSGAQSNAVDRTSMKETENTKQLAQLNKNMETLIASSDANLMLAGRNVSINDTNSRYLRGANFGTA